MTWSLDYWRLKCDERYSVTYDQVSISPHGMEQVIGKEELETGITTLRTKPLYDGRVVTVSCPICHFICVISIDLAPPTLAWFSGTSQKGWPQYKIMNMLNRNGLSFASFPINCPACDVEIKGESETKCCRKCGSDQINVVGSHSAD